MSENSPLKDTDPAELLKHIDVESVLKDVDHLRLLKQVNLESVLGGFGAAAGSELGVRLGRRLDGLFATTEADSATDSIEAGDAAANTDTDAESASDETTDESDEDADTAETDDNSEADESVPEADAVDAQPESRADLEALSYRELQSLTQGIDVKGNISKERMVDELAAEFGFEE